MFKSQFEIVYRMRANYKNRYWGNLNASVNGDKTFVVSRMWLVTTINQILIKEYCLRALFRKSAMRATGLAFRTICTQDACGRPRRSFGRVSVFASIMSKQRELTWTVNISLIWFYGEIKSAGLFLVDSFASSGGHSGNQRRAFSFV